jgi:hypothetical protein
MRVVLGREGGCLLERMSIVTIGTSARAIALVSLSLLGGCRETTRISPERSAPGDAGVVPERSTPERPKPANALSTQAKRPAMSGGGGRFALATPDAASGTIELVITDRPTLCGPHQPFPKTCEPAWRIRISLGLEHQQPGEYLLGEELSPFSYRDAQGKADGVWGAGVNCRNLGGHFDGVLEIASIEPSAITGSLTGAGEADGSFRAERCPSCNGRGMSCESNADCCADLCWNGRCQP